MHKHAGGFKGTLNELAETLFKRVGIDRGTTGNSFDQEAFTDRLQTAAINKISHDNLTDFGFRLAVNADTDNTIANVDLVCIFRDLDFRLQDISIDVLSTPSALRENVRWV